MGVSPCYSGHASPQISLKYRETNPSWMCLRIRIHYNVIHYCLVIIAKLKCHTSSALLCWYLV